MRNCSFRNMRYSAAPSEAMLLSDWLAWSVICTLSVVDRVSLSCGRSVTVRLVDVESTHLDHAACADLL